MRKTTIVTFITLLVLGVGAYIFLADPLHIVRGGGDIDGLAKAFLEDLQFKDFRQSAQYHHSLERDRLDIGRAIERIFLLKPELIDIQDYRIIKSEIDSNGTRGRTLVRTRFKRLNIAKESEDKDIVLYWIKRHPDCPSGGKCGPQGTCIDEHDKPMFKPKKEDSQRSDDSKQLRDAAEVIASDEPFSCDLKVQPRWYMNLDSTLKEKSYATTNE